MLGIVVSSCASTRNVPLPAEDSGLDDTSFQRGLTIVGYRTRDGKEHPFHGRVRLLDQGVLHFMPEAHGQAGFTLPQTQVSSVTVVEATTASRSAAVVVVTVTVLVGLLLLALSRAFGSW